MKNSKNQPGYILVFSLMFVALIVMLSTIISNRARLHVGYSKTMLDKERAKMLALSGLQIAMAQLAVVEKKGEGESQSKKTDSKEKDKKEQKQDAGNGELWTEKEAKEFIKNVYPYLNQWQVFKLDNKNFGTDGEIKISIGVEEGKVDLNQIFDFQDKKFLGEKKRDKSDKSKGDKKGKESPDGGDFKKVFDELFKSMGKFVKVKELKKKIENYLTKKQQLDRKSVV